MYLPPGISVAAPQPGEEAGGVGRHEAPAPPHGPADPAEGSLAIAPLRLHGGSAGVENLLHRAGELLELDRLDKHRHARDVAKAVLPLGLVLADEEDAAARKFL